MTCLVRKRVANPGMMTFNPSAEDSKGSWGYPYRQFSAFFFYLLSTK